MTQIFETKHKMPFGVVSSSVSTGADAAISSSFKANVTIANLHGDNYATFEDSPAQGPFTEAHVGGNQHRHVSLNTGSDTVADRPEAFLINLETAGELRVYGPDSVNVDHPRASMLRGNSAKRPVNISNIRHTTSSVVLGNFQHDYEIVQTSGRRINNRFLTKAGDIPITSSFSTFVTNLSEYSLPDRDNTGSNKYIFVERFNAPGGTDVSSRGVLDVEAEEIAPNNALPFRNYLVRSPLRGFFKQHSGPFGFSTLTADTGSHYTDDPSASYHKVNRNALARPETSTKEGGTTYKTEYDNWFIQHSIPRSDLQYAWISASAITATRDLAGYQRSGSHTNKGGAFTDITFVSSSETSILGTLVEHIGINPPDKSGVYISPFKNTLFRDKRVLELDGTTEAALGGNQHVHGIDLGPNHGRWDILYKSGKFSAVAWIKVGLHADANPSIFADSTSFIDFQINSGAFGDDELSLRVTQPDYSIEGVWTTVKSDLSSSIAGGNNAWTMVGVTYDSNKKSNVPSIYVDGVLQKIVTNQVPNGTGFRDGIALGYDFLNFRFGYNGYNAIGNPFSGSMAEMSVWDDVLTTKEMEILFKATKNDNAAPKQYDEHQIDKQYSSMRDKIVAWYSGHGEGIGSVFNDRYLTNYPTGNVLLDVAGKNNFHGVVGNGVTRPSTSAPGSFSSWGNSAGGYSSWKQTRTGEHPVVRFMRKNNYISVQDEPKQFQTLSTNKKQRSFKEKRGQTSRFYKEPPVSCNSKPLEHFLVLKGSVNPLLGYSVKYTHANSLGTLANKSLAKRVSSNKSEAQMYDKLYELYNDPDIAESNNPISKFLKLVYSENVFPREENTFLANARARTEYIVDAPGNTSDGYDRLFGTQRAFWRDNINDRHRTRGRHASTLNSMGFTHISSSIFASGMISSSTEWHNSDLSLFPLDILRDYHITSAEDGILGLSYTSVWEVSSFYGGELNGQDWIIAAAGSGTLAPPTAAGNGIIYHYTRETAVRLNVGNGIQENIKPRPRYVSYLDGTYVDTGGGTGGGTIGVDRGTTSSLDAGLQWRTAELAGKNPWYDSYADYAFDIRSIAKEKSILPEFRASEHMDYFIVDKGGNFRSQNNSFLTLDGAGSRDASALAEEDLFDKEFFRIYSHSDVLSRQEQISKEHQEIADVSRVTLKVKGVKKLLPYNGFYPVQRTVQLSSLLSQSIGSHLRGGYVKGASITTPVTALDDPHVSAAKIHALLQSFYAPGIMYNSIKAGIAVDWATYTGSFAAITQSLTEDIVENTSTDNQPFRFFLNDAPAYRFPFESLIFPNAGIPRQKDIVLESDTIKNSIFSIIPTINDVAMRTPFLIWDHKRDFRYELATSNFLAEVPRFFLKDEKLSSFSSDKNSKWKTFEDNKTYYMDVVLGKTNDFVMMESFWSHRHKTGSLGEKMNGRYFGFPVNISASAQDAPDGAIYDGAAKYWRPGQDCDPAFAAWTPPYFEGAATARLSFTPASKAKYTLDEVLAELVVENVFPALDSYTGSAAASGSMPVGSSVNFEGRRSDLKVNFNLTKGKKQRFSPLDATNEFSSDNETWVVSPRWECPTLNFSNQEANVKAEQVMTASTTSAFRNLGNAFSGSGYGRGMWSGYGAIPTGSEGIFLELRDSFPKLLKGARDSTTGSLIEQCGFKPSKSRIGELADSKEISEAVIAIPFLEQASSKTVEIGCHNVIKLDKKVFNLQRKNFETAEPAIKVNDLGSKVEIQETSITQMIDMMEEYVIPPQFNFLEFDDIQPFAMYIFEFKHQLDKQDLADIWQGVMPKIAMTPEKDEIEFSHPAGEFEFFGKDGIPNNLKWMVFKVKKKAEKDYFKVTADSSDDDRFKFDFEVGRKAPEYSYNWPYDFFSLVELGKLEVELEYSNSNEIEKLRQTEAAGSQIASPLKGGRNKRGSKGKGKKLTK